MKDYWAREAAGILKGLLARDNVGYQGLANKLEALGFEETPRQLRNKINRGTFSFLFFLRCLAALGYEDIRFTLRPPKPRGEASPQTPNIV